MKKQYFIIITISIIIMMGISYAYFTGMIVGNGKQIKVSANKLAIIFTDKSEINKTEIVPGWKEEKEFTIENKSNDVFYYDISIDKFINTFVTNGYLQFKITSDNGYNMDEFIDIPKSKEERKEIIAKEIRIKKGELQKYKIEFRYINSEEDQSIDMGKILSGNITINESTIKLNNIILANNPNRLARTNFNTISDETYGLDPFNGTLYEEKDTRFTEDGKVYYFAGDTRNNWVYFGGYYWRIIRINEDGSIRLLYVGESHDTVEGYIGVSKFNRNDNDTNNYTNTRYVGYSYGKETNILEENRLNNTDSTIKMVIDKWYEKNLLTSYDKYISRTAIYCNDRSSEEYQVNKYMIFSTYKRIAGECSSGAIYEETVRPSYKCGIKTTGMLFEDASIKDKFSGINQDALLKYPISLITADEIAFIGGSCNLNEKLWFLNNSNYGINSKNNKVTSGKTWFTMSPSSVVGNTPRMWGITSTGIITDALMSDAHAIRPVLSLKSCITWKSGIGTYYSPFEVSINSTCKTQNN